MKYITLSDVSVKLGGCSRSAIYKDIALGRLPNPIHIGRRIYWPEAELDNFLLEGRK